MTRPLRVVVDCDPALFVPGLDLDDDLALLFLLGSQEVEIVAVTTVFGNSLVSWTTWDARRLLRFAGRADIPVFQGASHFSKRGSTAASRFLSQMVSRNPGEIVLLALGPLSNVATAFAHSEAASDLFELVVLGGRLGHGRPEFNFRNDASAAQHALRLPCAKSLVTVDLGQRVAITPEDLDAWASSPGLVPLIPRLRRFAAFQDRFRDWQGRHPNERRGGFHPWDVLAAAWLVRPALFGDVATMFPSVARDGTLDVSEPHVWPVRVPVSVDEKLLREELAKRLGSPAFQIGESFVS